MAAEAEGGNGDGGLQVASQPEPAEDRLTSAPLVTTEEVEATTETAHVEAPRVTATSSFSSSGSGETSPAVTSTRHKAPRLSKQIGVDDETQISFVVSEPHPEEEKTANSSCERLEEGHEESKEKTSPLDNPLMRATIAGLVPLMRQVPMSRSDGNLRTVASLGSNPKSKQLVRSVALCADDDTRLRPPPEPHLVLPHRYPSNKSKSLSRDSSSYASVDCTDDSGVDLLPFFIATLHKNPKDRLMLLDLETQLLSFIGDADKKLCRLPAMSSYNRMLVHRTAAYFGLDHNVDQSGQSVVVTKTGNTRVPEVSFRSMIRGNVFTEQRKNLRRDAQSFEEVRHMIGQAPNAGGGSVGALDSWRRARSFEVSGGAGGAEHMLQHPSLRHAGSGSRLSPSHALRLVAQHESNSSTEGGTTMFESSVASCASSIDYPSGYPSLRDQRYMAYAPQSVEYGPAPQLGAVPYGQWSSCESYNASMEVAGVMAGPSQGPMPVPQQPLPHPSRPSIVPKTDSFSSYRYEDQYPGNNNMEEQTLMPVSEYPGEDPNYPNYVAYPEQAYGQYPSPVAYQAYPAAPAQAAQQIPHFQSIPQPTGQTIYVPVTMGYAPAPQVYAAPAQQYYAAPQNYDTMNREFAAMSAGEAPRPMQATYIHVPMAPQPQPSPHGHPQSQYYQVPYAMAPAAPGSPYFVPVPAATPAYSTCSADLQHSPNAAYPSPSSQQASPVAGGYRMPPAQHINLYFPTTVVPVPVNNDDREGSDSASSSQDRQPPSHPPQTRYMMAQNTSQSEHYNQLMTRNRSQDAGYGSMHQESMKESSDGTEEAAT